MKGTFLFSVVFILQIASGYARPRSTLREIRSLIQNLDSSLEKHMDTLFSELKEVLNVNVEEKLDHIEELIKDVANRQKLYHHCNDDVCDHGECYLPEGTEEVTCQCEQYWEGKRCNESNPCHYELYNMQFEERLLGRETPICDEEGFYAGMQYAGSRALCVTPTGERLSYSVARWETDDDMPCDCARDEYRNLMETGEMGGVMFNCTEKGGYDTAYGDYYQPILPRY